MRIRWFRKPASATVVPRRATSTQQVKLFLEGIQDGVIDLGGGAYRGVLEVSARNLDLVSPEEQDQIVARFRAFLNSLSFPIQILVRIERLHVERYLALLGERARATSAESLRDLALAQLGFVRELAASRILLSRRFLLVIPSAMPARTPDGVARAWPSLIHRPSQGLLADALAHRQVAQRGAEVIRGLEAAGLRARALDTDEVTALYYAVLCPTQARLQTLCQSLAAATTPAVRGTGAGHAGEGGD